MPNTLPKAAVVVSTLGVLLLLVLALGLVAENLGNWTDANPKYRVLAWIVWNLAIVGILAVAVWRWRVYRSHQGVSSASQSASLD